jgi:hypothetical protein
MKKLELILNGILIGLLIQRVIHDHTNTNFINKIKRYTPLDYVLEEKIKSHILANLGNNIYVDMIYRCNFEYVYLKNNVFTFYFRNNEITPVTIDFTSPSR